MCVLLAVQFACAGFPGFAPAPVPPEQQAAYDAALAELASDPSLAGASFERFLQTYPRSQLADDAAEQLAGIAFAEGRQEDGMRQLARILSDYPKSDREPAVRLRMAQLEYARDKRASARQLLGRLEFDALSPAEQQAALRLRADLSRTPVERLRNLGALRGYLAEWLEGEEQDPIVQARLEKRYAAVDRQMFELIERAASPELEEMMRELDGRDPSSAIALELTRRAIDAGQLELASRRLDQAETLVRSDMDQGTLQILMDRLQALLTSTDADAALPSLRELAKGPRPRTEGARGTIGVVLPLSGDFADFGQKSLRGILLATDMFSASGPGSEQAEGPGETPAGDPSADEKGEARPGAGIRLIVRDSEGDPARAAAAVRELASDPSVTAVVGPIFSEESLSAAKAAEEGGVPLVTLSTRESVPAGRTQVFRTRTTPADEVGVLVDHAVSEFEATRFAVLYPRTRYGRGMRKLYWDAVIAKGGKMVAASSYDAGSTDFATAIRDMIGYRFLTSLERKALAEREEIMRAARVLEPEQAALLREAAYSILGPELEPLPPRVDFDVLFIPDAAETIALIAPGLAFHEIQGVRLLGSSDWVDEQMLQVARRHVSGSVVSTPFYAESDVSIVSEFVGRYRATFGETPDAYAAQAFDATNLILVQLAGGRSSRVELRDGLLDTRSYPGAAGALTMRANGNARRRPFLLGISGRRFRSLD